MTRVADYAASSLLEFYWVVNSTSRIRTFCGSGDATEGLNPLGETMYSEPSSRTIVSKLSDRFSYKMGFSSCSLKQLFEFRNTIQIKVIFVYINVISKRFHIPFA